MIEYRIARPEDAKEIEEFVVFNFGENIRKLAQEYLSCSVSDDYRKPAFIVALDNEKIIGVAAFSEEIFTIETWGISWVSVHEDYRNQGIGQKVLEFCETEIRKRIKTTSTLILNTMPKKSRLYEKCDFKILGPDHSGGHFMSKTITPLST